MLDYIIWNVHPEIIEGFRVRWYGLFFALGFFISYTFLGKIFKKEGLSQKELDSFTFQTFILLIVGLRLGHCLLYEPAEYLANPIKILYVWEGGLASHGGAIGLLVSFILFARKTSKSFVWIASRAAVVIPFTAACVRFGNLMNSEIYGVATSVPWGFSFIRDAVIVSTPEELLSIVSQIQVVAANSLQEISAFFSQHAFELSKGVSYYDLQDALLQRGLIEQEHTTLIAKAFVEHQLITVNHPTQIYEALVYLVTFGGLIWYYFSRSKTNKPISSYLILSVVFISIFLSRFFIEFLKNPQVDFEQSMTLNMGQWLSLPFVLAGFVFLYVFIRQRNSQVIE